MQNTVFYTLKHGVSYGGKQGGASQREAAGRLYGGNRLATHGKTNAGSMFQLPASAMY